MNSPVSNSASPPPFASTTAHFSRRIGALSKEPREFAGRSSGSSGNGNEYLSVPCVVARDSNSHPSEAGSVSHRTDVVRFVGFVIVWPAGLRRDRSKLPPEARRATLGSVRDSGTAPRVICYGSSFRVRGAAAMAESLDDLVLCSDPVNLRRTPNLAQELVGPLRASLPRIGVCGMSLMPL